MAPMMAGASAPKAVATPFSSPDAVETDGFGTIRCVIAQAAGMPMPVMPIPMAMNSAATTLSEAVEPT